MKARLDMEKVARGLGAERQGNVLAAGGYFGAMQLVGEVQARFRVPKGGGRPTDPSWTERRLLPLAPPTLRRLEELAHRVGKKRGVDVGPMQMAALLLERTVNSIKEEEAEHLLQLSIHNPRKPGKPPSS